MLVIRTTFFSTTFFNEKRISYCHSCPSCACFRPKTLTLIITFLFIDGLYTWPQQHLGQGFQEHPSLITDLEIEGQGQYLNFCYFLYNFVICQWIDFILGIIMLRDMPLKLTRLTLTFTHKWHWPWIFGQTNTYDITDMLMILTWPWPSQIFRFCFNCYNMFIYGWI